MSPVLMSCSKVGFKVTEGSVQQIEAMCGVSDTPSPTGPKITAPAPDFQTLPDIILEGTCDGATPVKIDGNGITAPVTTACVDGAFKQAITLASGDGLKALRVSQDGIAGDSKRCVVLDTTPPKVDILAPNNIYVSDHTVSVIGSCESGIAVEVTQAGGSGMTVDCTSGKFSARFPTFGGEGAKDIVAIQKDPAGNQGRDNQEYLVDTIAPVVRILTPPANAVVNNSLPVTGTCESGLPVNLTGTAVTTPVKTDCAGGQFTANVIVSSRDGVFFIVAEQIDQAGNRGWDQRNVIRDTTPPAIAIKTPAAGTVATNGVPLTGTCTSGLPVAISGDGVSAQQTVECAAGSFNAVITFSSGDGPKTVTATQRDSAGNVGSDSRTFIRDSTPPAVQIASPAAGAVLRSQTMLTGTCETGLTVNLSGDISAATAACGGGQFTAAVTFLGVDGPKTVIASQTDAVGNTGTDSRQFTIDTTAPVIKIAGPVAGTTSQTGVTVTGTCTNGLSIQVSGGVASPNTAACNNGQFSFPAVFSAGDGTKNIMVAQTDAAGNTGSDNRDFVKDTTPPVIAITAPAAGTLAQTGVTLVGNCTNGLLVNISGAGVSQPSTTTCANGQFSTMITFSAGDGAKNVVAAQTDAAGNIGSDNRDFERDATAPTLQITGPAAGTASNGPLTVTGVCAMGMPVNISGDVTAPSTATCISGQFSAPITLKGPDGTKNIVASQTDNAGNMGSDNRNFVLDTSGPVIAITSPAAGTVAQRGLTLTGTCTAGLSVNISGDVDAPATTTCPGGTFSANVVFSNGEGAKNIIASQTDAAGNTGSDNRDFVKDSMPPLITITAPAAGTQARKGLTVSGNCTSGLTVNLSGTGLNAPATTPCNNGSFSSAITFSSGDGIKNIVAAPTDAAGNTGSDNRDFTRNNVGPAIRITAPAAGTTTRANIALEGTCTGAFPVSVSGAINNPQTVNCSGGAWSANVVLSQPDGAKLVSASQTDAIGNTGSDSRSFNRITAIPAITITTPAPNTVTRAGLTIGGTCANGLPIQINGGVTAPSTANCTGGQWTTTVTLAGADGAKNVEASQTDQVGNRGSANRDFILDTTAPLVKFTAPAANTMAQAGLAVTGACETGVPVQLSGTGLSTNASVPCTGGAFSANIAFSAGDGTKNIVATQTDDAGNTGTDNRDFVRNNVGPAIKITAPASGTPTRGAVSLTGTCTGVFPVNISGAITAPQTVTCNAGAWNAIVTLNAPDGSKTVIAAQTDSIGNTGQDSRAFELKTAAPVITIASPAANSVTRGPLTLTGTCTTGLAVNISGGITQAANASCVSGQWSANIDLTGPDGVKNVVATQTDIVGNMGTANRDFLLDATAPLVKFTNPAAGTEAKSQLAVSGTCETGLNVRLSGALSAPVSAACVAGQFSASIVFSAGDGTKNVVAAQTDAAGNTGTDNRDFVRDNVGPAIRITAPAALTPTRGMIALVGTCTGSFPVNVSGAVTAPQSVACSGGAWSASVTLASPDGTKNVVAAQTDQIGNVGSDNRSFVLQTAAPSVTIAAPTAGAVTRGPLNISGACTNGLPVQVSGSIAANVTATCNSGSYSAQVVLSGADGDKTITVSQTDIVGNTGSANRTFVLDTTAPIVKFTAPAAGTVAQTGLTVTGTCETGFAVQLNGQGLGTPGPVSCASGAFSANIVFSGGDGVKNIVATQTDAAGNSGSDNRDFAKDTAAPAITITSPAAGTQTRSTIALTGTCTDGLAINLTGAIAPGGAVCLGGQWSALVTLLPPDGMKNVIAAQTDAAGNTGSATRNFELKTTAPAIKITGPAANTVTRSALTVTGTCASGLSVVLSGAASGATSCNGGTFSANIALAGPDGIKNVVASQTDLAGNVGSDNRDFTLDTTAPLVKFSLPAAGTVAQSGLTVTGTCEAGLAVQLAGPGLGTPGPVSCPAGTFSANIVFSAGDGTKTITATQTDSAGNSGSDSRAFLRDGTAPVIRIVTPLVGAVTNSGMTLTGTCESGLTVNIGGTGLDAAKSANCTSGQFSAAINLARPDGSKNVTVSQTDAAGNTGSDNRNFMLDTTAPNVTIASPGNGTNIVGPFLLSGLCEAGLALNISGDLAAPATITCPASGQYNVTLTISAGNGAKRVSATQTDRAGNTGTATASFTVTPKPSATETFLADIGEGKVDILFVDDNSASMDPEQAALGQKFPSFVQEVAGLDWQIGITTTDCSSPKWGICGALLNMAGTSSSILTPNIAGYDQVFNNTIQRPETLNCAARGECPSGLEEGLKATIGAIDKRAAANTGFFRDGAALAVVILTDEDEQSNGPASATKPQAVVDKVTEAFGAAKKFKSYAITVLTGDTACLKTQQDQQGGIGAYGTVPMALASLTGGKSVSICAPDFSVTLQQIGQDLRKLTQAVKLARTPVPSSVQVTFTPAQNITWTVSGDTVLFNKPVAAGTKIDVYYEY